jgi:hypothetical protein
MAQRKALQRALLLPEVEEANRMRAKKANVMKTKRAKAKTRALTKKKTPECVVQITETDIYVIYDGVRIAERGKPGTPQAKTWISLEPGYVVYDTPDLSQIVVTL